MKRSVSSLRRLLYAMLLAAWFGLTVVTTWGADEDYLRHNEGDVWVMDAVLVLPNGRKFTMPARREIGAEVERDGKVYRTMRTRIEEPFPYDVTVLIRKDAKGLHAIDLSIQGDTEQTWIPLPLKIGQTWKKTSGPLVLNEQIVGVEKVVIGEKVFENCYHISVRSTDGMYSEDYWEAPNMGMIKSELRAGRAKMTVTLREFQEGKK